MHAIPRQENFKVRDENELSPLGNDTVRRLLAIRERWHVKRHPLYEGFAAGTIGLRPIGALIAQQYHHIGRVLPSLGLEYYKAPPENRDFMLMQLVTESGIGVGGKNITSSMEMCLRFCKIAGLTEEEVKTLEPLTIWRARAYFYLSVSHEESFGIYIAMKSVTEGQQVGINHECMLPALRTFHGYRSDDPAVQFFNSQFVADADVGRKMVIFAARLLDSPSQQRRGLEIAETAARYYWQAVEDIYRRFVLGEVDRLPPPLAG